MNRSLNLSKFEYAIFRNDNVNFNTDVKYFKKLCKAFHCAGFVQLHGISIYTDRSASAGYIGANKELIHFLNALPDKIALCGSDDSDYSKMSYDEQEEEIAKGIWELKNLFPDKTPDTFILRFDRMNGDTAKVCEKYGLRISAEEGCNLERMVADKRGKIVEGEMYSYCHFHFYSETESNEYGLSLAKLVTFLKKRSYTSHRNNYIPSLCMMDTCIEKNGAAEWYKYSYKEIKHRKHAYNAYKWIRSNIDRKSSILEVAVGAGGMLYHLRGDGFKYLYGYDCDHKAISVAEEVTDLMESHINFCEDDARKPSIAGKFDVILWINGMYHLDGYSLDDFCDTHIKLLENRGYIIFDMIDSSFNNVKNNEFCTQDWNKAIENRRESEYKIRLSYGEVADTAKKYGLKIVKRIKIKEIIPRAVYILKKAT